MADTNIYGEEWRLQPVSMEWKPNYGMCMVQSTLCFEDLVSFKVAQVYDDSGRRRDDLDVVVLVENEYRVVRFPNVITVGGDNCNLRKELKVG